MSVNFSVLRARAVAVSLSSLAHHLHTLYPPKRFSSGLNADGKKNLHMPYITQILFFFWHCLPRRCDNNSPVGHFTNVNQKPFFFLFLKKWRRRYCEKQGRTKPTRSVRSRLLKPKWAFWFVVARSLVPTNHVVSSVTQLSVRVCLTGGQRVLSHRYTRKYVSLHRYEFLIVGTCKTSGDRETTQTRYLLLES